jgi:hypothetical protein
MKKIIIYLICFLITWISTTFAETSIQNTPKLISSSSNSLNITWDKVENASWYYVYYSETSWKDYKTFWDIFEANSTTITWLKSGTTYYIVVTSLDKNTNDESVFSKEWVFNTKIWDNDKFSLVEIKVVDVGNLELSFNFDIDKSNDAIREFKITQNDKEITKVKETKLNIEDGKKLNLILENKLLKWDYKLTVIYITDSQGRNIEEWINWELKFMVTEDNLKVDINDWWLNVGINDWWLNVDIDNWTDSVKVDTEWGLNVELNAGNPEGTTTVSYWLGWKAVTWELSTWADVASNSTQLPKTGPESIFIIFASLIIGLVYLRKRKTI